MNRKEIVSIFIISLMIAASVAPRIQALSIDSLEGGLSNDILDLVGSGDIPSLHVCVVSGKEK